MLVKENASSIYLRLTSKSKRWLITDDIAAGLKNNNFHTTDQTVQYIKKSKQHKMLLLRARPLLPLAVGLSFGLATSTLPLLRRPLRLDSPGWTYSEYQQNAKTPITTASGKLNPSAVRQVSMGSITGTFDTCSYRGETEC